MQSTSTFWNSSLWPPAWASICMFGKWRLCLNIFSVQLFWSIVNQWCKLRLGFRESPAAEQLYPNLEIWRRQKSCPEKRPDFRCQNVITIYYLGKLSTLQVYRPYSGWSRWNFLLKRLNDGMMQEWCTDDALKWCRKKRWAVAGPGDP